MYLWFFLIITNAVQRKEKFKVSFQWKFRMYDLINFWIFKIIINALSVTDCLDNFLNNTAKRNEGELK